MERIKKILIETASSDQLSPFAQFCLSTKGHEFMTKKGGQLDKWELWAMGYRDHVSLIANDTEIISNYILI